jgi:predicted alpha/beta-fold hydrolase
MNHLALNVNQFSLILFIVKPLYFSGGTEEYGKMVDEIRQLYPHTQLLAVGFSMGGNIVTKYLGEDESHQQKFILGMAVCQGYDISRYVSFKPTLLVSESGYCVQVE